MSGKPQERNAGQKRQTEKKVDERKWSALSRNMDLFESKWDLKFMQQYTDLLMKHPVLLPSYKPAPVLSDNKLLQEKARARQAICNALGVNVSHHWFLTRYRQMLNNALLKADLASQGLPLTMDAVLECAPPFIRKLETYYNFLPDMFIKYQENMSKKNREPSLFCTLVTKMSIARHCGTSEKDAITCVAKVLGQSFLNVYRVWTKQCTVSLEKLRHLQCAGDAIAATPRLARLSAVDWIAVDVVLLYHPDQRLLTKESHRDLSQRSALSTLFSIVQNFYLDTWDSCRTRWMKALKDYHDRGLSSSLVVLQRRWYELVAESRARLAAALRDPELQLPPLLKTIATRCRHLMTSPQPSWAELVKNGKIHYQTPEEHFALEKIILEGKLAVSTINAAGQAQQNDDLILIEKEVETIELDADEERLAGSSDNLLGRSVEIQGTPKPNQSNTKTPRSSISDDVPLSSSKFKYDTSDQNDRNDDISSDDHLQIDKNNDLEASTNTSNTKDIIASNSQSELDSLSLFNQLNPTECETEVIFSDDEESPTDIKFHEDNLDFFADTKTGKNTDGVGNDLTESDKNFNAGNGTDGKISNIELLKEEQTGESIENNESQIENVINSNNTTAKNNIVEGITDTEKSEDNANTFEWPKRGKPHSRNLKKVKEKKERERLMALGASHENATPNESSNAKEDEYSNAKEDESSNAKEDESSNAKEDEYSNAKEDESSNAKEDESSNAKEDESSNSKEDIKNNRISEILDKEGDSYSKPNEIDKDGEPPRKRIKPHSRNMKKAKELRRQRELLKLNENELNTSLSQEINLNVDVKVFDDFQSDENMIGNDENSVKLCQNDDKGDKVDEMVEDYVKSENDSNVSSDFEDYNVGNLLQKAIVPLKRIDDNNTWRKYAVNNTIDLIEAPNIADLGGQVVERRYQRKISNPDFDIRLKGLSEEFIELNKDLLKLCVPASVMVERITDQQYRAILLLRDLRSSSRRTKVSLPSIDEVRRVNRTLLTAQVAPLSLTHTQSDPDPGEISDTSSTTSNIPDNTLTQEDYDSLRSRLTRIRTYSDKPKKSALSTARGTLHCCLARRHIAINTARRRLAARAGKQTPPIMNVHGWSHEKECKCCCVAALREMPDDRTLNDSIKQLQRTLKELKRYTHDENPNGTITIEAPQQENPGTSENQDKNKSKNTEKSETETPKPKLKLVPTSRLQSDTQFSFNSLIENSSPATAGLQARMGFVVSENTENSTVKNEDNEFFADENPISKESMPILHYIVPSVITETNQNIFFSEGQPSILCHNQLNVLPTAQYDLNVLPTPQNDLNVLPAAQFQLNVIPTAQNQPNVLPAEQYPLNVLPTPQNQPNVIPTAQNQPNVLSAKQYQLNVLPTPQNQPNVLPTAQINPNVPPAAQYQLNVLPTAQNQPNLPPTAQNDALPIYLFI